MFKLVVLCAFVAAAVAEPNPGIAAVPVTYSTGAVATPFAATYVNPVSGVYGAPVAYSSPFGYSHFIKKRDVAFPYSSYVAPYYSPLATTYSAPYYGSSVVAAAPVYTTAAHLIKKRAAVFPTATYVAPTTYAAAGPFVSAAYSAPVYTTPYVSAGPVFPTHFIKK